MWPEQHGINFFPKHAFEHFKLWDEVYASDIPSDHDMVSKVKRRNDSVTEEEDSLPIEEHNEISALSISEMKTVANILNTFFLLKMLEKNPKEHLISFDKKIDKRY
ncbi:hypothetical protein NPIL_29081 [Nephila pilipes]|uniref:Uncharacterized protein n=1 Tax=Nephila pilipes TaxID=299642 RepID=A0A8X6NL53_NEPPI|nr:hypothetical protein NPIL_29081 [Nephila pilipes]